MSDALDKVGAVTRQAVGKLVKALPGTALLDAHTDPTRWRAVTILAEPDAVSAAAKPDLDALGDRIEMQVHAAPGGRGSELAARFRVNGGGSDASGDDIGDLRSALRRTKQLIEAGEILQLEPIPHGQRPDTPAGKGLEAVTANAGREGVL